MSLKLLLGSTFKKLIGFFKQQLAREIYHCFKKHQEGHPYLNSRDRYLMQQLRSHLTYSSPISECLVQVLAYFPIPLPIIMPESSSTWVFVTHTEDPDAVPGSWFQFASASYCRPSGHEPAKMKDLCISTTGTKTSYLVN